MPEPFSHNPEAGPGQPTSSGDLARELEKTAAETLRSATADLADTLSNSLLERRAVLVKALGPAAYDEAISYFRSESEVNKTFQDEPAAGLANELPEEDPEFPLEEKTGDPESLRDFNDVENWLNMTIAASVEPYSLTRGQLFSQPKRFRDQGEEQVTISRYIPDTNAGAILEVTATGSPKEYKQLRLSLFKKEVVEQARKLSTAESIDLQAKLSKYHELMAEIADASPEEILEHAHHAGGGPEAEPA